MNYIFNENSIYDLDCGTCSKKGVMIMHVDHIDYENAVADFITFEGATILEIGYGMGLSATQIQANNPAKHVIIENHEQVYNNAVKWAEDKDNVEVILGDYKDVTSTLTDKFDGIYHSADKEAKGNLFNFRNDIKSLCNENCKLVMLNWDINKDIFNKANYKEIQTSQTYKDTFGELQTFIVYTTLINNEWDKVDTDPIYTNLK
jgi:hypothetical protein